MVRFINTPTPEPVQLPPIDLALAVKLAGLTGCTGPCHGLSANAAWAPPCVNCPCKEELAHG